MRALRRVIVLAKACAIVGVASALHGTVKDQATTFRVGTIAFLVSLGVLVELGSRANLQRLVEKQEHAARLTMQERQKYTEIGWNAGRLDALTEYNGGQTGDAQIVGLSAARRNHQMRRNGSA